jgi:hypothetical protein
MGKEGGRGTWRSIPRLRGGIFLGYRRCCVGCYISFLVEVEGELGCIGREEVGVGRTKGLDCLWWGGVSL